jgi:hypothetical protein
MEQKQEDRVKASSGRDGRSNDPVPTRRRYALNDGKACSQGIDDTAEGRLEVQLRRSCGIWDHRGRFRAWDGAYRPSKNILAEVVHT